MCCVSSARSMNRASAACAKRSGRGSCRSRASPLTLFRSSVTTRRDCQRLICRNYSSPPRPERCSSVPRVSSVEPGATSRRCPSQAFTSFRKTRRTRLAQRSGRLSAFCLGRGECASVSILCLCRLDGEREKRCRHVVPVTIRSFQVLRQDIGRESRDDGWRRSSWLISIVAVF